MSGLERFNSGCIYAVKLTIVMTMLATALFACSAGNASAARVSGWWGASGDVPLMGDWDGDGQDSAGIFRPSSAQWFMSTGLGLDDPYPRQWGLPTDIPIAGDWNGDGKDTPGLFRPSTGVWYLTDTIQGGILSDPFPKGPWGIAGDIPVAGDWDHDGKDSIGIFRPSTRQWFLANNIWAPSDPNPKGPWGISGDKPLAGDWNGDGVDSPGLFRDSNRFYYLSDSITALSDPNPIGPTFETPGNDPGYRRPIAGRIAGGSRDYTGMVHEFTSIPESWEIESNPQAPVALFGGNNPPGQWNLSLFGTGSTYRCQVDTGAWFDCPRNFQINGLAHGYHTFSYQAFDRGQSSPVNFNSWLWVQ